MIGDIDGVVNPIVRIENITSQQRIGVEIFLSLEQPNRYLQSVNGEVSISNVEYDRQNVIGYFAYITDKYNAPTGWEFLDNGWSEADTVELSGTL